MSICDKNIFTQKRSRFDATIAIGDGCYSLDNNGSIKFFKKDLLFNHNDIRHKSKIPFTFEANNTIELTYNGYDRTFTLNNNLSKFMRLNF